MPVLGTKLHVPAMRRRLVPRPRLTGRLGGDPSSWPRLVLVSAPAGFGKTTLLAQWLAPGEPAGPSPRVPWLSLDAEDSELRRFVTHLVAAIQTTSPRVGAEALAPGYVNDVLAAGTGGTVSGDIGLMQPAFILSSVGYLAGGVLFGLALFRARVLARWASGLLVLGTLATLAIPVLPHSFERPLAVSVGVALIGLGISLWRDQRKTAAITADGLAPARVEPDAVR